MARSGASPAQAPRLLRAPRAAEGMVGSSVGSPASPPSPPPPPANRWWSARAAASSSSSSSSPSLPPTGRVSAAWGTGGGGIMRAAAGAAASRGGPCAQLRGPWRCCCEAASVRCARCAVVVAIGGGTEAAPTCRSRWRCGWGASPPASAPLPPGAAACGCSAVSSGGGMASASAAGTSCLAVAFFRRCRRWPSGTSSRASSWAPSPGRLPPPLGPAVSASGLGAAPSSCCRVSAPGSGWPLGPAARGAGQQTMRCGRTCAGHILHGYMGRRRQAFLTCGGVGHAQLLGAR